MGHHPTRTLSLLDSIRKLRTSQGNQNQALPLANGQMQLLGDQRDAINVSLSAQPHFFLALQIL
jgi:hypothetical protein